MGEIRAPMDFSQIKAYVRQIVDRGGDSELDDTITGMFVNSAEDYLCMEVGGDCYFLEYAGSLVVPADTSEVVMPSQVAKVISVRDQGNRRSIGYIERQRWNAYIADPSTSTGSPLMWTRFGFARRDETQSPSYEGLKLGFWPVPSEDFTLQYDAILRPGHMIDDEDYPVIPISWQFGLIEISCWFAGSQDTTSRTYQEHKDLVTSFLMPTMRREAIRNMGGNLKFITREEHLRRHGSSLTPPSRLAQLRGG